MTFRWLIMLQVSWIRRRDAHILTVDRYTFIADERFQAFLVEATDTWTLQIKYVQARDAGQYECQVSTEPKMSHFITLNVVGKSSLCTFFSPYPTAFPYGNGMVLHFYQQQESSKTKTLHKVINKRLKTYV